MSEFTFDEIRSLGDAHKTYQYKLVIAPLPGSGDVDERILSMRNVSCNLPATGVDVVTYNLAGFTMHEAGLTNQNGQWSATFVESSNVGVRRRLDSWLSLCNERLTNVQLPKSTYQTTCEVRLHDGQKKTQYVGKFYGFFITGISQLSLDNKSSGSGAVNQVQANFSYDLWVPAN